VTRPKALAIVSPVVLVLAVAGAAFAWSGGSGTDPGSAGAAAPAFDPPTEPTTTAPDQIGDRDDQPPSAAPASGAPGDDLAQDEPVHEVLPGAGGPAPATPTDPTDPIGHFGDDGPVPAGLGFTAPPHPKHETTGLAGATDLAVAPSCSHQCITQGVAYARGFGAELVVEAELPVQFYLTAVADPDGDGDYDVSYADWTPFGVTSHSWALDHLLPGETYHVMVSATDDDHHTAYAWGEFTTLSQRIVYVELGSATVFGGPGGIDATTSMLDLNGTQLDVTPGLEGILLFHDLPRHVDLDYWMVRSWNAKLCESWELDGTDPQGGSAGSCVAWNSAHVDDVDLDVVPGGAAHWTQTSVELSLHPPTGAGDALPPGYGDPYYFSFEVPLTLHVSYS
jgi:hypothetical protein